MLDDAIQPDYSIPCRVCYSMTESNGWAATIFDCRRGFKDLPAEQDEQVEVDFNSPEFVCMGHRWRLEFGDIDDDASVTLQHLSNERNEIIDIRFSLCMRNFEGKYLAKISNLGKFDREKSIILVNGKAYSIGASVLFVKWSKISESVLKGALIVEVRMRREESAASSTPPFIPENPSACRVIQSLFMNDESSDIVFEVCDPTGKKNARKVARTEPVTFRAHRLILRNCSSTLADLCGSGEDQMCPIRITDSPYIFRYLLNYIYGGKVADAEMKPHAKEIIDASDKYGVPNLKLEAEACLVGTTIFSVENVLDHLLYADSKNCALLKEAAMDFIEENKSEVLKKVSFKDAPGTLISDVLAAFARRDEMGVDGKREDDFSTMRVSDLRRKVHEMGMNVDGSREVLIAILESTTTPKPQSVDGTARRVNEDDDNEDDYEVFHI
ncbi:hypothetical protein ACHAW5_003365 [Stephanodiscus triporus]|uniref:BTB domain-containing protein n=1 Tax=Stephanodiscus triporus TaxID=2934178 RepID=A0ABD3QTP3_9STRA